MYIDDCGKVCIMVKPPNNYRKERGKATTSAQSMRPRPDRKDGHVGNGVTMSPRGCAAPNVDERALSTEDRPATSKAADEAEDENFHSPREFDEDQPSGSASGSAESGRKGVGAYFSFTPGPTTDR